MAPQSKIDRAMKTITYEATVENGQIKLPGAIHLPDHTKVFVVVHARLFSPAAPVVRTHLSITNDDPT